MDGTLIDSMKFWRKTAGDDIDAYDSHIAYLYEKYSTVIAPKDQATEFLELLRKNNVPVAIATDTPRRLSEGFFRRYDFDSLIDVYVDSDHVGIYKFHGPDIYFKAAEELGFKKEECLVFEDNLSSVQSAFNAGFDVVGIFDSENAQNEEEIRSLCVDYIYNFNEMVK